METFEVVHKMNPGQSQYNTELKDLLEKLKVVEAFYRGFFGVRTKEIPWRANALKSAFEQHLQDGVVWLPEKVKIVERPGDRAEEGYGEVQRVRIAKMPAGIPSDCDFAAKKLKAVTPLLQQHAQCIKACVNPIQHPSIIKFWAVHHKTMESYTLWWNGGSLASFLQKFNLKVLEATPNNYIGLSIGNQLPEDLDNVMLY